MTLRIVYLDGAERIIEDVERWCIPAFKLMFPSPLLIQVKTPAHGPLEKEYELYIVDQNDISFFEDITKKGEPDDNQKTELHPDNR